MEKIVGKNWKTTVFGSLASLCAYGAHAVPEYSAILMPAAALFGAITAHFMKDKDVTGGSIDQTK